MQGTARSTQSPSRLLVQRRGFLQHTVRTIQHPVCPTFNWNDSSPSPSPSVCIRQRESFGTFEIWQKSLNCLRLVQSSDFLQTESFRGQCGQSNFKIICIQHSSPLLSSIKWSWVGWWGREKMRRNIDPELWSVLAWRFWLRWRREDRLKQDPRNFGQQ